MKKMMLFAMLLVLAVLVSGAFLSRQEAVGGPTSAARLSTTQDSSPVTEFLNSTTLSCSSASTAC